MSAGLLEKLVSAGDFIEDYRFEFSPGLEMKMVKPMYSNSLFTTRLAVSPNWMIFSFGYGWEFGQR